MPVVSPYRVTPEDLATLKPDVLEGLAPLLDALNVTLPQLVQASQAIGTVYVPASLTVGLVVADSFPFIFKNPLDFQPREVRLANITPKDGDHVLTAPFVMQGWGLTDQNLVSVPWITGLLASNSYSLSFAVEP
jgi:hypothetical protein